MAEINKRNLIDETAATYAANTTASNPAPLFSTGMPAKIARASMANTNLLSSDGDLFVGTGSTYTETIDGTEYTYAKIAKKNQSELFVNGLNGTATNVGLAASVGKFIDDRLHISTVIKAHGTSIIMGDSASSTGADAIVIGTSARVDDDADNSVAIGKNAYVGSGNAIQLGTGENIAGNTFQVGQYQMLDLSTGKIPLDRINRSRGTALVLGNDKGEGGSIYGNTIYGIDAKIPTVNSDATVIGYSAEASTGGVVVGANAYCKGINNIAIGYGATLGIKDNTAGIENCIVIGAEAKIENSTYIRKTAIQLGKGTNSSGGFQVWDYQLLTTGGMIVRDRLPTLYKHRLKKDVVTGGSGSGASYDTYICEWYSNKHGLPTTQFNVMGHIVKWNSQQPISTGDSLADFEFKNNNLTVKYLGGGGTIATFAYNEIEESFGVQEI